MKLQRSISAGPRRSTEQVVQRSVSFTHEVLTSYGNPAADDLSASLIQLAPVLRYLVVTRGFRVPALTLSSGGLEVELDVDYSPEAQDDLEIPTLIQGRPDEPEPVLLLIRTTAQAPAGLLDLVAAAQSNMVTVTVLAGEVQEDPSSGEPPEAPAAQDAPEKPASDEAEDGPQETEQETAADPLAECSDGEAHLPAPAR